MAYIRPSLSYWEVHILRDTPPPPPHFKALPFLNPIAAEKIYRGIQAVSKNRMNIQSVDLQNSLRVSHCGSLSSHTVLGRFRPIGVCHTNPSH